MAQPFLHLLRRVPSVRRTDFPYCLPTGTLSLRFMSIPPFLILLAFILFFPYFAPLQPLVPFPQHRILHLRRRACRQAVAVGCREAIDIPGESTDGKAEDDDKEQCPVCVGEALHLGCSPVDACRLGELPSGGHLTLVAVFVLRIVPVRHLLAEQHPSESLDVHKPRCLIVDFRFLFDVLVQQGAPVHDEQPVWVVLCPGYTLELSCRHQLTHQDVAPSLDALPSVVGELHLLLVEGHAVAIDGEHRTRT